MTELQFFNPYADIRHTENRLPHWQQESALYFITFRLADAVPARLQQDWQRERETWMNLQPEPWNDTIEREYHKRFSGQIEQWLDAGHGSCVMQRPACAAIVADTLRHFDGDRIGLISSIVMP